MKKGKNKGKKGKAWKEIEKENEKDNEKKDIRKKRGPNGVPSPETAQKKKDFFT